MPDTEISKALGNLIETNFKKIYETSIQKYDYVGNKSRTSNLICGIKSLL